MAEVINASSSASESESEEINVDHEGKEHKEPYSFAAIQGYLVFGKYPPSSSSLVFAREASFLQLTKGSCITLVGRRRVSLGLLSRAQKKGYGLSQQFTIKHTLEETKPCLS